MELTVKQKTLVHTILTGVPQIPFIIDQVNAAINLAKEQAEPAKFDTALNVAVKCNEYASAHSEKDFFKYHLAVVALLAVVPKATELPEFANFIAQNTIVKDTLTEISKAKQYQAQYGEVKGATIYLANVAKENPAAFLIELYYTLEKVSKVTAPVIDCIFTNLRMSNLDLPPVIQPELDKVITALAKIKY